MVSTTFVKNLEPEKLRGKWYNLTTATWELPVPQVAPRPLIERSWEVWMDYGRKSTPPKININWTWWFGSDDFPLQNRGPFCQVPAVDLPGCVIMGNHLVGMILFDKTTPGTTNPSWNPRAGSSRFQGLKADESWMYNYITRLHSLKLTAKPLKKTIPFEERMFFSTIHFQLRNFETVSFREGRWFLESLKSG